MSDVLAVTSMRDYFRDAVDAALARQAVTRDEATSAYLVDLLCEYARQQQDLFVRPLTWIFATADSGPPVVLFEHLKQVGDHSLYVAGYFNDSLPRLQLDLEYFVELGGTAYRRLSRVLRAPLGETRLVAVFSELGHKFLQFVHVLDEVRRLADCPVPSSC